MVTAFLVVKNRAYSKLAAAITAGATTLTVTAGDGANFPSTYPFHLTLEDEIVSCTNRSTDSLTIVRAQQGTTGVAHANKTYVALNITASSVTDLNTAVNTIEATVVSAEIILGDDKFVKFGAGTDAQVGYETADGNAFAVILALPHTDEDANNVAVLAIGDIDIVNVDLGFFNGVVLPTVAVLNVARDAYISIDSGDINASGKGVYFKAAADEDVEIINLSVGGTPRIYWDETENQFRSTHGWVFDALCDVQGVWVATATWTLPAITLGGDITGGNYDLDNIGHIGLGNNAANPRYIIIASEALAVITDDGARHGQNVNVLAHKTSAVFAAQLYGGLFEAQVNSGNTQNWTAPVGLIGVDGWVKIVTGTASPSTITGAASFYAEASIGAAANDMVLTNYYGLYVEARTLIGNSKLTNDYGIWIGDQAGGATLSYAIYTNAGLVHIGDDMDFAAGKTIKSGSTNGNTLLLAANDTTFITFATGATDVCTLEAVTLKGTLLADGTVILPAITFGGDIIGQATYDLGSGASPFAEAYIGNATDHLKIAIVDNVPTLYGVSGFVRIGDAGTTAHSLASEDDLMVSGILEVKGNCFLDAITTIGGSGTLDVSAGTLTLAADQISGDKVEGGTIAAITITTLTVGDVFLSNEWAFTEHEKYGIAVRSPSGKLYKMKLEEIV